MLRQLPISVIIVITLTGCATGPNPSAQAVQRMPSTGYTPVEGGRVWYEVHGSGTRTPLLVLHGGPGIPHDYLENLAELGDDRPVIFYDQLGCGKSDKPDNTALWTRERFSRELDQVRKALGLDEVILYGHSWGTILAVDYLNGFGGTNPQGVRGLILAGPALDIPRWTADSRRLIQALDPQTVQAINEGERTGQTDTPAYQNAMHEFYARYVCRCDPWPDALNRAVANMGEAVYGTMNGPSEFTITGTLRNVDVTGQLVNLRQPILFICGEYDEATPESTRHYASLAPNGSVVVIPGAAHCASYDQPQLYFAALRKWLREHHL